jgi:hypothetical protein
MPLIFAHLPTGQQRTLLLWHVSVARLSVTKVITAGLIYQLAHQNRHVLLQMPVSPTRVSVPVEAVFVESEELNVTWFAC